MHDRAARNQKIAKINRHNAQCRKVKTMKSKKTLLSLKEYIAEQVEVMGIDKFKHQFGVTESCVNHWRRADAMPRPHHVLKIVKLSGGRVTAERMNQDVARKKALKTKRAATAAATKVSA